jgi:predicted phosphodiesterase
MKLHILSDLHLGSGGFEPPATDADVVILAGDIARPSESVPWARRFGKPVLYVAGNHEFYGGSIDGTIGTLRRACAGSNIQVLDDDEILLGGVRFLGATLWTDFALFDDPARQAEAMAEAQRLIRDFSRIRRAEASDAVFTPQDSAALFRRQASWLSQRLAVPFDGPTVVITHHAPSTGSIQPRFAGSLLNACFVSAAERLLDGRQAPLWIHGHTHDSFDYRVNGTRVVCNPRGYAKDGVNENPRFDPALLIDIVG